MKAIIIEDNTIKINFLNLIIQTYIENISFAKTGNEAFKLLKNNTFKFIFLDHNLPDCKGSDILSEIKEQHPNATYITISHEEEIQINYKSLGYDHVLRHPYHYNIEQIFK